MTELVIGRSVNSIGNYAFYGCSNLASIYAYPITQPSMPYDSYPYTVFKNISPTGTLHYPSGSNYSTIISRLPSGWTAVADL